MLFRNCARAFGLDWAGLLARRFALIHVEFAQLSPQLFCLDGRKLLAVSGSYGADGTDYRTEEDTFARITLHRSPQNQIASFEVRTKDGRIRTYAPPEPIASYVTSGGKPRLAISWPLQKERDRSGNSILYSYDRQGALDAYPLLNGGDFIGLYPGNHLG